MDTLRVEKYKSELRARLAKLPPAHFLSIPIAGEVEDQAAFALAVNQLCVESGGKFRYMSMGSSISIGRTIAFRAAMTADALAHLESKGLAISAEQALELGDELPGDMSISKPETQTTAEEAQAAYDALKRELGRVP